MQATLRLLSSPGDPRAIRGNARTGPDRWASLGCAVVIGWCGPLGRAQLAPPAPTTNAGAQVTSRNGTMTNQTVKTDQQWRQELTPEQYQVLRQKGTERAFTGQYWNHHAPGLYRCAGCGFALFSSATKFDSGCGWPSFYAPVAPSAVKTQPDNSHFLRRTEVLCPRCGGHLGRRPRSACSSPHRCG